MGRDIRFSCRVILNPAQYESLEFCLDETVHLDSSSEQDAVKTRDRLISAVKLRIESEVVEARRDIAEAKRKAEMGERRRR